MTRALSLVALGLGVCLVGCGDAAGSGASDPVVVGGAKTESVFVEDPASTSPPGLEDSHTAPPASYPTGCGALRTGFHDHSVNAALAESTIDDVSTSCSAVRLETTAGVSPAGAFNGTGNGNKAMVGVDRYGGLALATLATISFDAKRYLGQQTMYVNVVVDLACDGTDLRILVVDPAALGAPAAQAGDYGRYSVAATEAQWRIVGGIDGVLPAHVGAAATLDAFLSAYPSACVANAATGDKGMPAGVVTSGIMLIVGDSVTTTAEGWYINRVTVNGDVYPM